MKLTTLTIILALFAWNAYADDDAVAVDQLPAAVTKAAGAQISGLEIVAAELEGNLFG